MNDETTPNSCASKYTTPRGSENSFYYSPVASEDGKQYKENSINGGQWTVTDSRYGQIPKAETSLLRKVLKSNFQANFTPRNKTNKRLSFKTHAPQISVPTVRKNKQQSSGYQPVDPRKKSGVLKNAVNKVEKSVTGSKTDHINVNKSASSKLVANAGRSSKITLNSNLAASKNNVRLTKVPPRKSIMTKSRPVVPANIRPQRRESKHSFTSLAVANTLKKSISKPLTSNSVPVSKKSTVIKNGGKCQYCGKFFAKSHGLKIHLHEKCEIIPAAARRQLS